MATEFVTIVAGGRPYGGWKKVSVIAAMNEAVRTFHVETTELPGEWSFPPGTPVQVMAGGSLLVDGYVNRYTTSGSKQTHNVSISGRGKGQDYVDCSGEHSTGYAKEKTPAEFGMELDRYGVGINAKIKLDKVPYQQLRQGETCFRCLERHLRPTGATLMGEPDGSISITDASVAGRAGGALTEGVNILEWSVSLDDQDRFGDYTVKGQNRHGTNAEALRIKEKEFDRSVKRFRNRMIINETDTDRGRAKKRAKHEKDRSAGKGKRSTITVQGWRDDGGALWTPNTLIFIHGPRLLHLVQDMLIERVTFDQDDNSGTTTKIAIVDPRAYGGKGQNGKGTDPAWGNESWAQDGMEDR